MLNYSFRELRIVFSKEIYNHIMNKIKVNNANLSEDYLDKYYFINITKNGKLHVKPKIKIIPGSENAPFNGDKEIKKHIAHVTSYMEATIQLEGVIASLEYIINNIKNNNLPHEFTFAGCISVFFSFFKESKGFNKLDPSSMALNGHIETFKLLEKLRDEFYCHKQSAIGYNILGMYIHNDEILPHTKEQIKPFFVYPDMQKILKNFKELVELTIKHVREDKLEKSSNHLKRLLNNERYKYKLMQLIEKEGNDDVRHSELISKILENLELKDRVQIKGNNV